MSVVGKLCKGLEKKYVVSSIMSPVFMIGEVLMETLIPFLMSLIVDKGIADRDLGYVIRTGLLMVVLAFVSLACGAGGARAAAVGSLGFSRNLRRNLFCKVQEFSFSNVDRFSTASLVTRLTTDVTNIQNVFQLLIRICIRAPFMLIAGIIMAFLLNPYLAIVFVIAVPFLAFIITFISIKAYPRFAFMLEKYDRLNSIVQENLIAIRVVKAYVRGEFESEKFEECAKAVRNAQVRAEKLVIFLFPVMQLTVYACLLSVFWFGGNMIVTGFMKTGELISFITYVTQILMSLMMMGMVFVSVVLSKASVNRVVEVLDEEPEIKSPFEEGKKTVENGDIDFDHVWFSYSKDKEKAILRDIDIHIKSGSVVGIIGGTGSSKSSLVNLIPRLYEVTEGSVKVSKTDVRQYETEDLRNAVSVVLQKNILFSGTIRENLLWGDKNASDEEISLACRASDAEGFIRDFPKGYETELGQGGVNLSGGQKQRLCIARALLKKPKILILDDSTSAVDTATEKRIREALRKFCPETTKIIIAQRISSVKDADVIFVLDDGKVSGFGNHQELLENNEIYREVYESQKNQADADSPEGEPNGGVSCHQ